MINIILDEHLLYIYFFVLFIISGHQQKQLVSETKNIKNDIQENEQQDLRISSISPELTVCSESMDANSESETE